MTAWANILFLLFVVFLAMFMTHVAIRHERLRERFRGGGGGGGAAISRAGGTANSPLDGASLESFNSEGFRSSGGIGGAGGHGGGGLGGGHIGNSMGNGHTGHVSSGIKAPARKAHRRFEHKEDHGRRGWHQPIDQPHHYPGGGATITRNWMGSGKGDGWFGYGWPFVWWGPAWYPEYAYICNKDSDCAVGKCGQSGFCIV